MSFPFVQPYFGLGNSLQTAQATGGAVGGWVEVGRSSGTLPSVTSLPDKRYYMILNDVQVNTSAPAVGIRLGNSTSDTGTNYSDRYCQNDSADITETSQTRVQWHGDATTLDQFSVGYISNLSGKEKLMMNHSVSQGASGAATAPSNRWEGVGKWVNTSNPLDRIDWFNIGSGSWASSSEMVVLGWDESDTHTTNFWQELADTTFTSSGVSAQTFTAKKYIWCQFWFTSDASGNGQHFQLGDTGGIDTGSTYARRFSINGGSDSTSASQSKIYFAPQTGAVTHFVNMFMINNASNEKLVIVHATTSNGSGAGNAPQRRETVGKWVETTNQCDRITIATDVGTFTGGQLKVWGSN